MSRFDLILTADPEQVVDLIYASGINPAASSVDEVAQALGLNSTQLICALGFRADLSELLDIVFCLGFNSLDELIKQRNRLFVADGYQFLSLQQVFNILTQLFDAKQHSPTYVTQILLKRAERVEHRIESTVKPSLIENYRQEMKSLYATSALPIEFVMKRLENVDNGFRALIDEIGLIVDAGIFSADTLFHRHDVLAQEKRRLIKRGLIDTSLIKQRLQSDQLAAEERELLEMSLHEKN